MTSLLYRYPERTLWSLLLFLGFGSIIYNGFVPLHGDEAYYWVWSLNPQGGYFDHAPLIAWMIALSNLVSDAEWGVRLSAVIAMSIAGLYIYRLTCKLSDTTTALNALFIYASVVLVHAGYTLVTPDAPLILFWSLSLYYGYEAIFEDRTSSFVLLGLFLGLMMLGKYSAILFALFLVLFALLGMRTLFRDWRTYIVMGLATIIVIPMLLWNYQHDWISFTFQLSHGSKGGLDVGRFLEFFAGQFGVFTPVFTAVLFYFLLKKKAYFHNRAYFYVALSVVVPLLFFFYKSLGSSMELNYTAPAYIGGAVLLALIFKEEGLHRTFKAGLAIALLLTIVARYGLITHLELVQDRMYGNKEAIALLYTKHQSGDAYYADHLTTAALMQYYLPGHPKTQIYNRSRFSQYDLWRDETPPKKGLYLTRDPMEDELKKTFKTVTLLDTLSVPRGFDRTKTFYIYRVSGATAPAL